jgi:hypothetical protein
MERSRLHGHEQRPLKHRWSRSHPHERILDYVWQRWNSYLQALDSGRCRNRT